MSQPTPARTLAPVTSQPHPAERSQMDLYGDYHHHVDEKIDYTHQHEGCPQCESRPAEHKNCHNSRLRRFLLPAIVLLVLLGAMFALSCAGHYYYDIFGMGSEGLARRATDAAGNTNGSFVHNKLYLIVVFVGLLVVIVLAVMLSAWCCRGAFENPLCCPCYLCACCGGLACLECIGCGLCAEGVDQM